MKKGLRILAGVMVLLTLLGAGIAAYAVLMFAPKASVLSVSVTPAAQAMEMYERVLQECEDGLFGGRVFGDVAALDAQDCSFVTYTLRIANNGLFPAEWITPIAVPAAGNGADVLQLASGGANVLLPRTQGDIAVTVLTTIGDPQPPRTIELECYVFGRKTVVYLQTP